MNCPIDPKPLQPPLRTEEFETLFHLLKESTVCRDLIPLLVYQIDTVDVSVLPHLAEQFDVLGYKGWLLADTEEKKRNLVKSAVKLHRKAGTPSAIIDSLFAVGIEVDSLSENPPLRFDGYWNFRGAEHWAGKYWDRFTIDFTQPIPDEKKELVEALINTWKNERSHRLTRCPNPLLYNQVWEYDGSEQYDNCTTKNQKIGLLQYTSVFEYDGIEVYDGRTERTYSPLLQYDVIFNYSGFEKYDARTYRTRVPLLRYNGTFQYNGDKVYDQFPLYAGGNLSNESQLMNIHQLTN